MNHDRVGARVGKRKRTFKRIFHAAFENKALDSRTNHKVLGALRLLSRPDFFTEIRNRRLRLLHLGAEQTVFLESGLILDNDH